jgi:hypothetical protein
VSLAEALQKTVAERMHRSDVSPWQKASDVAEYQAYLKSVGRPHSTRDIAQALGVPQTRVSEQLIIAAQLDSESLTRYGVTAAELTDAEHRNLLRIAKLPHYLREKPIRDLARARLGETLPTTTNKKTVHERRRADLFAKLRDEGQLLIEIPAPINTLTRTEARTYLDEFLPALAHLAELIKGANRSHYIGLAGNGGIVIYLSPAA